MSVMLIVAAGICGRAYGEVMAGSVVKEHVLPDVATMMRNAIGSVSVAVRTSSPVCPPSMSMWRPEFATSTLPAVCIHA